MIKKILKYHFFIGLICLLNSCTFEQEKDIQKAFYELRNHLTHEGLSEETFRYFDKQSVQYFEDLAMFCNENKVGMINSLGTAYDCQLNTLLIYQMSRNFTNRDSINNDSITMAHVLLWTSFVGPGFLRMGEANSYEVMHPDKARRGSTILEVKRRLETKGKHFIGSKFKYEFEDGAWKINIPSIMTFDEKLLQQQLKRSGKTTGAFLKGYLSDESIDGSFYYRE